MQTENFIPTRSQCDQLIDRNELEEKKKTLLLDMIKIWNRQMNLVMSESDDAVSTCGPRHIWVQNYRI